jgi:hypothetical protein
VWASGNTVGDNETMGLQNAKDAIFESASSNAVRNSQLDISGTIPIISTK